MVLGTVICLVIWLAYGAVYRHRSDNPERGNSPAYHRRRFYRLGGFRYIFRRTGGTWKRHSFITDFTLPVCCGYHPTAFLLSRLFGAVGVWNAFWITEAITAIISICVYYKAIAQSQLSQSTVK